MLGGVTRASSALASPTRRKLALLVGIQSYKHDTDDTTRPRLKGAHNDVQLQYDLLTGRFGFNPRDIVTLRDEQATRNGIERAFQTHLIDQAAPGDVVVFHFSGHGSRLYDASFDERFKDPQDRFDESLVCYDSNLNLDGVTEDIPDDTLDLLLRLLGQKTDLVTVVLDCCFSGTALRGEYDRSRIRSLGIGGKRLPSAEELAFQDRLRDRLKLSREAHHQLLRNPDTPPVASGALFSAGGREEAAMEIKRNGAWFGVLTYALTGALWGVRSGESFVAVHRAVRQEVGVLTTRRQNTRLEVADGKSKGEGGIADQPCYFTHAQHDPAVGLVKQVSSRGLVTVGVGGLRDGARDTILVGSARAGKPVRLRVVESRGLEVKAVVVSGRPEPGMLVGEQVRALWRPHPLKVGAAPSLSPLVVQALKDQGIPLEVSEQADYWVGTREGTVGLFDQAGLPRTGTFGHPNELPAQSAERLVRELHRRGARDALYSLINTSSRASIEVRAFHASGLQVDDRRPLRTGENVFFELKNADRWALHIGLIALDSSGQMLSLYPNSYTPVAEQTPLRPGQSLRIGHAGSPFKIVLGRDEDPLSAGPVTLQVLALASAVPFTGLHKLIRQDASPLTRGPVPLTDSQTAVEQIFEDLKGSSVAYSGSEPGVDDERVLLDVDSWTAVMLDLEVVDAELPIKAYQQKGSGLPSLVQITRTLPD